MRWPPNKWLPHYISDKSKMINFSLAGYYSKYKINMILLSIYNLKKEVFYENIQLSSVYGSLPGLVWAGGRIISINEINPFGEDIYQLKESYNKNNIFLRHTFTNLFITDEMLNDFRCNQWTAENEQINNGVIVTTEKMANYIKDKYPKYQIIWSTSRKVFSSLEEINKITKEDMVVLHYSWNNDFRKLSNLKNPKNIEILCGEFCIDDCPFREKHYEIMSKAIINNSNEIKECNDCYFSKNKNFDFYNHLKNHKHFLTNEQVNDLYNKYGIQNFKLNGRSMHSIEYIETLIYYLIKPQYKDQIRLAMLLEYYNG